MRLSGLGVAELSALDEEALRRTLGGLAALTLCGCALPPARLMSLVEAVPRWPSSPLTPNP